MKGCKDRKYNRLIILYLKLSWIKFIFTEKKLHEKTKNQRLKGSDLHCMVVELRLQYH